MLGLLTVVIMGIVAYAYSAEGLFTSFCMLVNVVVAGLIAFCFFEPLASMLEGVFRGSMAAGYEDFLVMILLFSITLGVLRLISNSRNVMHIEYNSYVQQFGGILFGLVSGYVVAGFLVCAIETMPWHENFLFFEPRSPDENVVRRILPADRAWLAAMRHAGSGFLAWKTEQAEAESRYDRYRTFDPAGSFEERYLRYRRFTEKRPPIVYSGEFDLEIGKGNK